MQYPSGPKRTLRVGDAVVIVIGIVVGAGIFKTPSLVAMNAGSETVFLLAWMAGGAASLIGALCYAELASTYPDAGGDYHFLNRAFGRSSGFLLGWARMTVIQTGSIAMLGFLLGDYLTEVHSLGKHSSTIYAAGVVIGLTAANIAGIRQGSRMQRYFIGAIVLGLLAVVIAGFLIDSGGSTGSFQSWSGQGAFGSSMIFVLLTYGGWNEAAYLSGEVKHPERNMIRVLLYSIGAITLLYLLINLAMLKGLGLSAMSGSEAVAADLMRKAVGEPGAKFISLLIALTVVSTMNGTIITGARTNYALGRDVPLFSFLGHWQERRGTPANALLLQGGIALILVGLGTLSQSGFVMMVEYTAPVFWFFLFMAGLSIFRLRARDPEVRRPFSVPLYPLVPLGFCAICLFMLASSVLFTGKGALVGIGVLCAGLPVLLMNHRRLFNQHKKTEKNDEQKTTV
ncbi:MAG: APC family permease [Desulfovibrionales bacterium]